MNKEFPPIKSQYSQLVSFAYKKINYFLKDLSIFLLGIFEFDRSILIETDKLMIELSDILSNKIDNEILDLETLAYISNDAKHLSYFDKFILEKSEELTQQTFKKNFTFNDYMSQIK